MVNEFLIELVKIFWFLLPAGIANIIPALVRKWKFLDFPVDFGIYFRGERLFGQNKTWRGFVFGILGAIIFVYIQQILYPQWMFISLINYDYVNVFYFGFLIGFGALFGDLVKSFFKRRMGISPGKPWVPFDQVDYVLGALILTMGYAEIGGFEFLAGIGLYALLHPVVNYVGYLVGIKGNRF